MLAVLRAPAQTQRHKSIYIYIYIYIYNRAPSTSERFYRNTYIYNRAPSTSERDYIIIYGRAPRQHIGARAYRYNYIGAHVNIWARTPIILYRGARANIII